MEKKTPSLPTPGKPNQVTKKLCDVIGGEINVRRGSRDRKKTKLTNEAGSGSMNKQLVRNERKRNKKRSGWNKYNRKRKGLNNDIDKWF